MSEKIAPGPVGSSCFREAVCIHTNKVYDSCKSKECIRDLRVYLTAESQQFINNNCVSVKPRAAELLFVNIDVEKVPYKPVPPGLHSLCAGAQGVFFCICRGRRTPAGQAVMPAMSRFQWQPVHVRSVYRAIFRNYDQKIRLCLVSHTENLFIFSKF